LYYLSVSFIYFFFFFSSRRRHTRFSRDWSSDVCSSDLWTKSSVFCPVRIIQVPGFIHNRFQNSDEIPLFQMIAKNVGIRRAYGRFILATNIDIIFSNELMQFLASANLNPNRMYRIDRYDVHADIPAQMRLDERLDWCYQHLLRIYRSDAIVQVQSGQI